jgi:signal transduction histidine kinase
LEEEDQYWRNKTLDFLVDNRTLLGNNDVPEYRRNIIFSLKKYSVCDDIHLIKRIDNSTEIILISSKEECENIFTETSFLINDPTNEEFIFISDVQTPNRFHFLYGSKLIILIPLIEKIFNGIIIMSWNTLFPLNKPFKTGLEICITRTKEMIRLNFTYLTIKELKVKFNAIFHTVSQALIFMDNEGRNTWINPKAKELLNILLSGEEFIPELVSEKMTALRRKTQNSADIILEAANLFKYPERKIDNWLWIFEKEVYKVVSTPVVSEQIQGRLWIFEDISEIYFAKQKLEIINKEKNNLISIVSHDLRSPLNQVLGFSEILNMNLENLNETQKFSIVKIKSVAERGLGLIKDLLDINAIEQQKVVLNNVQLNIKEIIESEVNGYQIVAMKKNMNVNLSCETTQYTVWGDKDIFYRIMENLVSNAIKFSHKDKSVYIDIKNTEDKVVISIKDEGQGMTEEDQKNLFKKFQRLSAKPTAGESSSGLGLSIVKTLVEQLNGQISCESEWKKGTTFKIEFPIYKTDSEK